MADGSSMNHPPFDSTLSARLRSFPSAAFSMTIAMPSNLFQGNLLGPLRRHARQPCSRLHVDIYYLGLIRKNAPFNSGVADEKRQTISTRIWGRAAGLGLRYRRYISVWRLWRAPYPVPGRWLPTPAIPLLAYGASRGSGCKPTSRAAAVRAGHSRASIPYSRNSRILRRPRSMRPSTSSMSNPSVTVQPLKNFAFRVGVDVLWRYSTQDAFYQPPGVPLVPGSANKKRFLGAQSNLQAEWQATAHISVNAAYVHFLTAGFLEAAGAKDIDFLSVWSSYNSEGPRSCPCRLGVKMSRALEAPEDDARSAISTAHQLSTTTLFLAKTETYAALPTIRAIHDGYEGIRGIVGGQPWHHIHCGGRAGFPMPEPLRTLRSIERCVPCNSPSLARSQTYD